MKKLVVLYLFVFAVVLSVKATHIVGGEISYEHISGNQYRITLKVYRDCLNGLAAFDDPASVGIFTTSGNLVQEVLISSPSVTNLPIVVTNPCLQVPPVICTEEAIYQKIVTIPSIPSGGLDLVYQRCCRNSIIQNINTPQDMGSTYITHIPDPQLAVNNTSAHFINVPPLVLCNGDNFVFDHSAYDADGDVLVYEMCTPFHGANSVDPMPQPPNGGPYTNITWSSGYGVNNQINGTQNLQIDPNTGELTCTPTTNGVYVVGICVKEYRNGQLINTTLRDFQFTVVTCSSTVISAVPSQTILCDGYTMEFQNNSVNGTFWFWDFGVPGIDSDTSILEEPTYTYPDTGNYEVMLIANPGWPCADTSTAVYSVQYPIQGSVDAVAGQCFEGNSFDFAINGNFTNGATFDWDFGGASNPMASVAQNPTNVEYLSAGTYTVTSTVNDRGCSRDFTQQVEVYAMPNLSIEDVSNCNGLTVTAVNNSQNTDYYHWDFGDASITSDTSNVATPTYTYDSEGVYTVELIGSTDHCVDTTTAEYTVKLPMNLSISTPQPIQCKIGNSYDFMLSGHYSNTATFNWSFGSSTIGGNTSDENPVGVQYTIGGVHFISVTVIDDGCQSDATIEINVINEPIASFESVDTCESLTANAVNHSFNASSYHWDFGVLSSSTDTSNLENTQFTYPTSDTYDVMLIAYNDHCSDTAYGTFKVKAPINPNFSFNLNPQCITTNSFDFTLSGEYTAGATFDWDFGGASLPLTATDENPSGVVYSAPGIYEVQVTVTDEGCSASYTDSAKVFPSPDIEFSISDTSGCMPLEVQFTNESIAWGDVDYSWDFGDGTTSTEENPKHTYLSDGVYDVKFSLTTNQGCLATLNLTNFEAITVHPRPVAGFSVTPQELTVYYPDVEITDLSSGVITTQYYTIEGNIINDESFTYTTQGMGEIDILLTVINSFGCEDTALHTVYVEPTTQLYIPNSFSPNGDGVNDEFKPIGFGVDKYHLYIFDRWGKIAFETTDINKGWDGTRNGKKVPQDVYIWKVTYRDFKKRPIEKIGHITLYR